MSPVAPTPLVAALHAYVPGEQPREPGWSKLNTNECPYPASPAVVAAVRAAADESLFQKYPDPASTALRAAIAARHGVEPGQVFVGNGSDEVLRLLCQAYLRPGEGDTIGMVHPTYSLYVTLAAMVGCGTTRFDPVAPDYAMPEGVRGAKVRVLFIANPNPPIGTLYDLDTLADLAVADPDRLVVIDEAYVDFAGRDALPVFRAHPNVVITRTFSKSHSLAGLRVGYAIAPAGVVAELDKIRDSYNLNRISQAAAEAALADTAYHSEVVGRIVADRGWLAGELRRRGFVVPESHGNFVFARRPDAPTLYAKLREAKVLVRHWSSPELADGLRITVGTRPELERLLAALDA